MDNSKPFYISLMLLLAALLTLGLAQAEDNSRANTKAEPRLFSYFNVIRFQNNPCNTSSGNAGVCYTSEECTSKGGTNGGSCAAGYGICCQFQIGCGQTSSANCTYFTSSDSDTSPCTATICRCNSNICQLRLDFNSFTIAQPDSASSTDAVPNSKTECHNAWFTATSDGTTPPVICGTNTGYHMYVEASSACNALTFSWATSDVRGWNIKVCQIGCDDPNKPPEGCTQYFTGPTNVISTFNYQGGVHLANQNQDICIRRELGYCSINYWQTTPTSFQISGPAIAAALAGASCSNDYIELATPQNYLFNTLCGGLLGPVPGAAAANNIPATVKSNSIPFWIRFVSDSTEGSTATTPTTDQLSKGFQITYQQGQGDC